MLGGACGSVGQRSVAHRPTCPTCSTWSIWLEVWSDLSRVDRPTISGAWMTVWWTMAARDAERSVGLNHSARHAKVSVTGTTTLPADGVVCQVEASGDRGTLLFRSR